MKNVLSKAALAALATAATAGVAHAQTAAAPSHTTSWTGTVGEDRFGDARFKMRGRFQYDMAQTDWDIGGDDGFSTYTRRAFLGVQGRLTEQWRYKVDFVLDPGASDSTSGRISEVAVDDAFLEYVGGDWSIVIGEHNITAPLEDRISSLDIPFIERSGLITSQGFGRLAGIGFITGGANWHLSLAAQGDSLNDASAQGTEEQTSLSGRFTFAPIFETTPEGTTLVHLGVYARQRTQNEDSALTYSVRPQNGRGATALALGASAEEDFAYGVEGAVQFGAFGATAQWGTLEADEADGDSYSTDGYYVDAYWSLTGESRVYRGNQGSFGAIAPRRPFGVDGGLGHWMLSARYDVTDMTDGVGASQGEQTAYGVGLDWVPVDHVRFKLNFAQSDIDYETGTDNEAQIITLRSQFDF
jgi:phosphate-selective porin OprO and OprP